MPVTSFFAPLRARLILLVLLLVIPAFGLVLYGNLQQRRIEQAGVREGAVAIAQLASAHQENFIKNTRQLLATLTQFPFLVLATNRPFCETHFSNLRQLAPDYLNFGLIEADGTLFCSATATNGPVNLADRSYFRSRTRPAGQSDRSATGARLPCGAGVRHSRALWAKTGTHG